MTDKNNNAYVEPIYKVNYVKNGVIDSIYVFKKDKDKDINNFFTQEELEQIRANNTKVVYLNETIHLDDSIGTIKIKILNQIKKNISLDEIYLYCRKVETFNAVSVYQVLTQNKHINLTNVRLYQFISRISIKNFIKM